MLQGYILYGFALFLAIYIVVHIIRDRKFTIEIAIALLGIVVSVIVAKNIQLPVYVTPSYPTPTHPIPEVSNWNINFEYQFPSGFWTVGNHQYTIDSNCATGNPDDTGSRTHQFVVAETFGATPTEIYLRWTGVTKSKELGAETFEGLNPSQTVIAVNIFFPPHTKTDIEWIKNNCTSTISWDSGSQKQPLNPKTPYQR